MISFYLGLTVAVEVAVLAATLGGLPPRGIPDLVAINVLTQPLALTAVAGFGMDFWAVEGGVWIAESLLFRGLLGLGWTQAAGLALLANAASASLSFIV